MNQDAANTTPIPRGKQLQRRRGVRGKLAERLGLELRKCRVRQDLSPATVAERAGTTPKRLAEIEEGETRTAIGTIERIAETMDLDWSTVFVPLNDAGEADSSKGEGEVSGGA
jgi:transcriptional regulator with XRE-family HTH domain